MQWFSGVTIGRARRAVHAGPCNAVGGPKFARRCFFLSFLGEEGALLEYLHAGPLQPCYATELQCVMWRGCSDCMRRAEAGGMYGGWIVLSAEVRARQWTRQGPRACCNGRQDDCVVDEQTRHHEARRRPAHWTPLHPRQQKQICHQICAEILNRNNEKTVEEYRRWWYCGRFRSGFSTAN